MGELAGKAKQLLDEQKNDWPLLRDNVAALANVRTREIDCGGELVMRVQFNPARIASTGANVDAKTIRKRKCFLCDANRPPEQRGISFGADYTVLCNPFPIFPEHFTIPHREHRPQRIVDSFSDLLGLAHAMGPRYSVFYNGPKSGASAPDHLHFQAGDSGWMPIEAESEKLRGQTIARTHHVRLGVSRSVRPFITLEADDRRSLVEVFDVIYRNLANIAPDPDEPQMNVIAWFNEWSYYRVVIFPRAKHRPSFYYAEGDDRILLSPGCVDLGGVCIVPLEHDFLKLDRSHIDQMLREVMLAPDAFSRLCDALAAVVR
jgi:Domain of unknown function (DUF4922)